MITLRDRLSRLTIIQAEKLLGVDGKKLIVNGGRFELDLDQVHVSSNIFRLTLPQENAIVSIVDDNSAVNKMRFFCSECSNVCNHIGAAFSLILEEKTALGLAKIPPVDETAEALSEHELIKRELLRREDRSKTERLKFKAINPQNVWSDYVVTNEDSGKTYRVALRGVERGESFCTCPDFRKNTLGTCKHIMFMLRQKDSQIKTQKSKYIEPDRVVVYVKYQNDLELHVGIPNSASRTVKRVLEPFKGHAIDRVDEFVKVLSSCQAKGEDVLVYPDAQEFIDLTLHRTMVSKVIKKINDDPQNHPYRTSLLNVELLPYQLEGIAFFVGAARAVLADEMGLGKTVQAIGAAKLLQQLCGIGKVLVVCPASVKSQWSLEITRFSGENAMIVSGESAYRNECYESDHFFTICNYEQVLRDLKFIEKVKWDFIILDEGQRIKNWEAKTSKTIKSLKSRYALVLSGTPLENRLEELYSVIEFIDDRRLGPDFRFEHTFKSTASTGKTKGYKNLNVLRELIKPILLRRTRSMVLQQLPPKQVDIIRVIPTQEQIDIHDANLRIVNMIIRKKYISQMDLLRMQKALLSARMSADSTFLCDKQTPSFSSKLERLSELLIELSTETKRKILVFSEWTTMLDLIEKTILKPNNLQWIRLDGSVPQGKRNDLVKKFTNDPSVMFFMTSNAGAVGLNLQVADTVVNIDLPWNPAILDQRIGRAHRMGQKNPVQVYLMVSEQTIEEKMLSTLGAKKDLSLAALDFDSDVSEINLQTGIDDLKRRLEILLGEKPKAPVDISEMQRIEEEALAFSRKEKISRAGGKFLVSALEFIGEMVTEKNVQDTHIQKTKNMLMSMVQKQSDGTISLTLNLDNENALDSMAKTLARFLE